MTVSRSAAGEKHRPAGATRDGGRGRSDGPGPSRTGDNGGRGRSDGPGPSRTGDKRARTLRWTGAISNGRQRRARTLRWTGTISNGRQRRARTLRWTGAISNGRQRRARTMDRGHLERATTEGADALMDRGHLERATTEGADAPMDRGHFERATTKGADARMDRDHLERAIDGAMARDRRGLASRLRRLRDSDGRELRRLAAAVERSRAVRGARIAGLPVPEFPAKLPITAQPPGDRRRPRAPPGDRGVRRDRLGQDDPTPPDLPRRGTGDGRLDRPYPAAPDRGAKRRRPHRARARRPGRRPPSGARSDSTTRSAPTPTSRS